MKEPILKIDLKELVIRLEKIQNNLEFKSGKEAVEAVKTIIDAIEAIELYEDHIRTGFTITIEPPPKKTEH